MGKKRKSALPVMGTERRRSTGRALADALVARHLLEEGEKDWGFWGARGRIRQGKLWPMEKL